MATSETLAEPIVAPARLLAAAADRRSFLAPLLAATAAALVFAAVVTPRLDFDRPALDALERDPAAAEQLSPHDRDVALAQARKLGAIRSWSWALFGPSLLAGGAALALVVGFRVADARPALRPTLAVTSWGLLPLWARELLLLPAASRMHGVSGADVDAALPSSLAALLPLSAPPRLAAFAASLDLFSLWAVALVAVGMAHAARTTRARAAAVVLVLWAAWVLVARVALPGLLPAPHP